MHAAVTIPHRLSVRLVAAGCLVGNAACEDDGRLPGGVPAPPIVWEGEHVRIGTELELDDWCPANPPRLDAYVGALEELLGADEDGLVTYYLFEPPLSDVGVCPSNAAGCAIKGDALEGIVLTDQLVHDHEVVHAIGLLGEKTMPHVFEEGAATYWGGLGTHDDVDFSDLDMREVLAEHWEGGMSTREYARSAHFTSHLVHDYGIERYLVLRRGASWHQSRSDFERTFAQTMGTTLDAALTRYEQAPYCDLEATRSSFLECARAPDYSIPADGEVTIDVDVSCADPRALGPGRLGEDGVIKIWLDLTVELEADVPAPPFPPSHDVFFESPALGEANTVTVAIKRCAMDCSEVWANSPTLRPRGTPEAPDFFTMSLLPGRYVVRVSREAEDPGPVRFRWQ